MAQLYQSLNKAAKQYEKGKVAQAGATVAAARVAATRDGDKDSVVLVNEWIEQLAAQLDGADRDAFDAAVARADTALETATQTAARKAEKAAEQVDGSQAGLILAGLGALSLLISVFLPYADSSSVTFFKIEQNTLIQNGAGWAFVILGVVGAIRVYAAYRSRKKTWAPIVSGALAIGYAVYFGNNGGNSLQLCSVVTGASCQIAHPGTGVYLAGVGGLLMAIGGFVILSSKTIDTFGSGREVATAPAVSGLDVASTKICPDCAETVLAAARVCKHCGYRFAGAPENVEGV